MNPQASLGGRRREAVRVAGTNKLSSPRGCLAGEVIGGELGDGIKGENRKNCEDAREEGDEDASDRGRCGVGDGRVCGSGRGFGFGDAMELGGTQVENLQIATVAQPCLEGRVGDAERQWVRREHHSCSDYHHYTFSNASWFFIF